MRVPAVVSVPLACFSLVAVCCGFTVWFAVFNSLSRHTTDTPYEAFNAGLEEVWEKKFRLLSIYVCTVSHVSWVVFRVHLCVCR